VSRQNVFETKAVFLSAPYVILCTSFLKMNRSSKWKLNMSFLLDWWDCAPLLLE